MGEVTFTSKPEPFDQAAADAEDKVNPNIPKPLQPEAKAVEDAAVKAVEAEAAKAPAAEEAAAAKDPGVDALARDAAQIGFGGTVAPVQVFNDAVTAAKEVKTGYKTTEFWLTGAVIVLAQVGALTLPGKYGSVISEAAAALSAGLYAIGRGIAKK